LDDSVSKNPLGYEKIGKLILRFSGPAIASNVLNAVYNIVDQIFIGHGIGYHGIAATTITFPITTIVAALSIMMGIGTAANFNLHLGAGNKTKAGEIVGNGLSVMTLSGVTLMMIFMIFLTPLLNLFGATPEIMGLTMDYARIIVIGVPFQIITVGSCYLIRADGAPNWAMISMMSGAVFNLIFDPVFMFGFGWGIKGIAWATTLGQLLSASLALSYIIRGMKTVDLLKTSFVPKLKNITVMCSLGVSAFVNQFAMTLVNIVLNNTLKHYGDLSHYGSTVVLGAVGVIAKINTVLVSCFAGVGHGCQPIYSFNYGAKNFIRVKETLKRAITCNISIGVFFFALFQIFPHMIIGIFGKGSPDYFEFATRYLRIFMFMTFSNGIQSASTFLFSSTGRAKMGAFVSLTRQILFLIPLLLILPFYFGIDGVVFAGPVADTVSATLSIIFLTREFRKLNKASSLPVEASK
jgi:Na+-driven multidrug efflux pump